jgi:oligoribonuclease
MFKLLWIDMEMTGLDVEKEVVIEVAALVTTTALEPVDQYHAIVKQPQAYIDQMDDWNKKHHRESGLTELIPTGKDPKIVEDDLLSFMSRHFDSKEKIILAGNSIGQDRLFINKYFKRLAERLHYRMLDVTAFKVLFNNFYQISYAKKESRHRAVGDVLESINELKKYIGYINVPG